MSLENTTWTITGIGDIVCQFEANNVVKMTFPNGQSTAKKWGELNGAFAIESSLSATESNKCQVYAGACAGKVGHGVLYSFGGDSLGIDNEPRHFTMTQQS